MTLSQRSVSLRFGAITVLVIVGLRLFAVDAGSGYLLGMLAMGFVIWLYGLAMKWERS